MTKRCKGCGILLQSENKEKVGYTPDVKNDLCERCFKLKNYNILTNKGVTIDNDKIIDKINKSTAFVLFLVDFLTIDSEVIDCYKKIKNNKVMVLTKMDLLPKNIKINKLLENIKNIYNIDEKIIACSSKYKNNLNMLKGFINTYDTVLMAGFTNAGKSSLINALAGTDITVSKKINTTQDFITVHVDDLKIIDAPGFMSDVSRDMICKNEIRPKAYQLKCKYFLLIGDVELHVLSDSNLTIYVSNEVTIERRRDDSKKDHKICVPNNSDVVIKGIGFIKFSNATYIDLNITDYEIRTSIIGGRL